MIKYFFITLVILLSAFFLLAIGYIVSGKVLQGSCGGLGKLLGKDCEFCEKKDQCKFSNSK